MARRQCGIAVVEPRTAGRDAARTWLGARGDLGAPEDALAKSVAERVKQTLAQ